MAESLFCISVCWHVSSAPEIRACLMLTVSGLQCLQLTASFPNIQIPAAIVALVLLVHLQHPPFAPRPHYGQQVRQQHQQRLHSTAASSRSGATSAHTDRAPPSAVSGVLLGAVNSVLLTIQCCVRRKTKEESKGLSCSRQPQGPPSSAPSSAVVRYDPLSNPLLSSTQTVPSSDVQQYHYKHYHIHAPNVSQPGFQDFPVQQGIFAQSPTESSQTRFQHGVPYHRSGSIAGHHRHTKGMYQKSPPLGQTHRPLLNPLGQPQTNIRSDLLPPESYKGPIPPSYEDILLNWSPSSRWYYSAFDLNDKSCFLVP
ncbi:uncharacterized protein CEXT_635351 [Caerostris extrusa]|uniref:Uncharacterized protein n=1 Tax=Caerostris extrusa TaxID=172846 RepID=A0AAV4WK99_CAEEX|nr:uncharacterized protein CEXT_635351 [Caerostris extrusa]